MKDIRFLSTIQGEEICEPPLSVLSASEVRSFPPNSVDFRKSTDFLPNLMDLSKSSEFDFICTRIDALKDIIKEESGDKVTDTSHNAINIDEVVQELYLLTKGLNLPPNFLI